MSETVWCEREDARAALIAVSAVFRSIGRALICLDRGFHIIHVASMLQRFAGEQTTAAVDGRPVSELLGEELFGPDGTLRQLLEHGYTREGWRATMRTDSGTRTVSI